MRDKAKDNALLVLTSSISKKKQDKKKIECSINNCDYDEICVPDNLRQTGLRAVS